MVWLPPDFAFLGVLFIEGLGAMAQGLGNERILDFGFCEKLSQCALAGSPT